MKNEGFQLDPAEIAQQIHQDIVKGGWHLATYADSYVRPDFGTGMMLSDPVDRAVVVFVGSRDEANAVVQAAQEALGRR